jgi:CHASE2 domain-containing sensor protein
MCHARRMADPSTPETVPVPWSARSPQRYVFAALAVIIGIAVVLTALAYIRAGTGGVVPFLMITVGPVLAVVYVYYFGFRKFDQQD